MPQSDLAVALAGGAIGAAITAVGSQLVRIRAAWSEVALHDQQAADANESLVIWVDDATQNLVREIRDVNDDHGSRGTLASSLHIGDVAFRKAGALHRYRDQRNLTRLFLVGLKAQEGVYHSVIRRLRGRQEGLALTADHDVEPFLVRWREPARLDAETEARVFDRTKRTLEDALDELSRLDLG
jgi:hypothetical protein